MDDCKATFAKSKSELKMALASGLDEPLRAVAGSRGTSLRRSPFSPESDEPSSRRAATTVAAVKPAAAATPIAAHGWRRVHTRKSALVRKLDFRSSNVRASAILVSSDSRVRNSDSLESESRACPLGDVAPEPGPLL